jgi:zinc finger CCCH domain-containing protein 13
MRDKTRQRQRETGTERERERDRVRERERERQRERQRETERKIETEMGQIEEERWRGERGTDNEESISFSCCSNSFTIPTVS